jgi:hypothetical protein
MKIETIIKQIEKSVPLEQFLDELHIILKSGPSVGAIKKAISADLGAVAIGQMLDYWIPDYTNFTAKERRRFAADVWPVIHLQYRPIVKMYDPTHPLFKHFTKINFINFGAQKQNARKRGIPFEFDFLSWLTWWLTTGKFDQRGVFNHSYQMCRMGDTGSYHPDNVYCATGKENRNDFHNDYVLENGVGAGHKYIKRTNQARQKYTPVDKRPKELIELTKKLELIEQQRQDLIRKELDKNAIISPFDTQS